MNLLFLIMDKLFNDVGSLEEFRTMCNEILNHMFDHEELVEHSDDVFLNSAKKEIHDIICKTCCNVKKISNELLEIGYEADKIDCFISEVEKKKNKLLYLMLLHHNSSRGEAVALFDCALKLVLGTSDLKTLKYPILQLALTTYVNAEQNQRLYDLDKNMLLKLINVLEESDLN